MDRHYVVIDGKVFLRTENDGWAFLRHGPEAEDEEVTLEYVRDHPQFKGDYERVASQLNIPGFNK